MTHKNYTPFVKKAHISRPAEAEPIIHPAEKSMVQEAVEREPHQEVAKHIEVRPETIKLPENLKKIGLHASKTSAFSEYKNIKIPLSDDKVLAGLHAPITSALRWLATFAYYLLRKAHLTLKVVHGKVVRIIQR